MTSDDQLLATTLEEIRQDRSFPAGRLFLDLILRYLEESQGGQGSVSTALGPEELLARFAEPPPVRGRPLDEVVASLSRDVLADSLRVLHPRYLGPPVASPLPSAIWTEAVIAAMNQTLRAFVMSPTGTALELCLVRWMGRLVGFAEGCGGTFTSGATEANFTALYAARAACLPRVARQGVGPLPPVVVCGENVDFSVRKAVAELGLGLDNIVTVPTPDLRLEGEALALALDEVRRAGHAVMAVVATAGSYATGSFDELEAIGRLCQARGLWLHVDAAHGGTALFSERHRHLLRGLERASSVAIDPHKTMSMPISTGLLLVRRERDLDTAFALRDPARGEGGWDQARRTFTNSRRLDALKLWVVLQRHGLHGVAALYDQLCRLTLALHQELERRPDFEPLHTPQCNIICFRYLGRGPRHEARLDALNRAVHERGQRESRAWMNHGLLGGRFALKVAVANPETRLEQMPALLDEVAVLGREVEAQLG